MKIDELDGEWTIQYDSRPISVVGMRKVLCLRCIKWVWVGPNEALPYRCEQKQLHAPLAEP